LAYFAALGHHWADFVTGGVVAALATLGVNVLGIAISRWLYGVVFMGCGVLVASFRAWEEQYEEVRRLTLETEALRTRVATTPTGPRLSLRFDPQDPLCASIEGGEKHFRVQVINDGDTRATNVSVALAELQPPQRALLLQRFHMMKSDKDVFDVGPSLGRPAVYVDVLTERPHTGYGHTQIVRLKGAQWITDAKQLKLVLRLEADVKAEPLELIFAVDQNRSLRPATT
jgi:hypothetical protein